MYFSYRLETARSSCNSRFQPSLDTVNQQSQSVFGDRKYACRDSYELIAEWDLCLVQEEGTIPREARNFLKPMISSIMQFTRDEQKDLAVVKHEHDERCRDETRFMFYPPEFE